MTGDDGWFYMRDGGSAGPETASHLLELLDQRIISRQTLVWRQDMPEWQPLEVALGLSVSLPPPPPGASVVSAAVAKPQTGTERTVALEKDYSPHPWRRYFARMLDTTVSGSFMFFIVGMLLVSMDQNAHAAFFEVVGGTNGNRIIESVLTTVLATLPNAVCIGFVGTTLGKWIFGVSVQREGGDSLGFPLALKRELLVWAKGFGLGIPLISFITVIVGYQTLKREGKSSWDSELNLVIVQRAPSPTQTMLNCFGVALWLAVLFTLIVISRA